MIEICFCYVYERDALRCLFSGDLSLCQSFFSDNLHLHGYIVRSNGDKEYYYERKKCKKGGVKYGK